MPTHDIIDNRTEKLIDHLNQILRTTERARFAVGYLFLSGLTSIAKRLLNLKELRLLIGNTSNRETVEMLAEGYRRLELAKDATAPRSLELAEKAVLRIVCMALTIFPLERPMSKPARPTCAKYLFIVLAPCLTTG